MRAILENTAQSRKYAEDVYRLTNIRFQNGAATSTDIILAERDLTKARSAEINAQADTVIAAVRLKRALGQEWPSQ